ncbi:MAG TPA: phosphopantetheine-binding protein, partial [Bradyrhizobium sp.]|nr:phosphopantetheine-binding protein [Bradyrhizobium sp.]
LARTGIGSIEPAAGLKALDKLMAAPLHQLAFVTTTKPWNSTDENIRVLRDETPSVIAAAQSRCQTLAATADLSPAAGAEQLDHALSRLLLLQLQATGKLGETGTLVRDLETRLGLLPLYRRWLKESVRALIERGLLVKSGEVLTPADNVAKAWSHWDAGKDQWLGSHGRAMIRLAETAVRALPDILRGAVPATDVLFPNGSAALVEGIYKKNPTADFFNSLLAEAVVALVEERRKSNPSLKLRILEIGAGTGGTSAGVLERLKRYKEAIAEYRYTDLSRAFLLHGEDAYGPDTPCLRFSLLNIEKPLAAQGIEPGSYDVVIAANVLHATADIRRTLRNAKAALRRNGVLLLNEMSRNSMFSQLTFGLLEGWWLYQDDHLRIPGCPGVAPDRWRDVLADEGFRAVSFPAGAAHILGHQVVLAESDGIIRQELTPPNTPSRVSPAAIAATMPPPPAQIRPDAKALTINVRTAVRESVAHVLKMDGASIADDQSFSDYGVDSILSVALMKEVNKRLKTSLATIALFDHNSVGRLADHIIAEHHVSLAAPMPVEVRAPSPTLRTVVAPPLVPAEPHARALTTHVAKVVRESVAHVLKMDGASIADDQSFSDYGVDSILSVSLVKEVNKRLKTSLATITLFDHNSVGRLADHIVAEHHAGLAALVSAERSALIEVSVPPQRPVPAAARRSYVGANEPRNGRRFEISAEMPVEGRPACWQVVLDRPMDVGDISLVKVPLPELGAGDVRIAVRAFSLNFGDLLCVRGLYPTMPPYPFTPGSEISGTVVEVGRNVSSVRPGDSVIALMGEAFGGQATFVTCREEQLMRKPAVLSFEQACAFPVVTMTMVDAFRKAKLRKGESILIQTAAGGTGLVAVQMAQHYGGEIFATAGSTEKLDYLAGLGVRQLINYRQIDFETEIKRLTGGRGVDVVINTLSGDALQKGMRCLSAGGRYIEIAMTAL